jgi:YD repeat-containing protein
LAGPDGLPNGTVTATNYTYYPFGALRKVDQSGLTRTFSVDWLGRKTSETHPESGTTSYQFDSSGRVSKRTLANIDTTYGYDFADRLKSIQYTDGTPTVTYAYDEHGYAGFLTTASVNGVMSTAYTYNVAGQLASEQATLNGVSATFASTYGYDMDGRLQTIGYPSGRIVQHTYQVGGTAAIDRVNNIVDTTTLKTLVQGVQDNPAGQTLTRNLAANQLTEGRTYNIRNQLTSILGTRNSDGASGKVQVATTGRVKVRVDASRSPIRIGDLLVTSDKEGMAMRSDAIDAGGVKIHRPGTLIGKALESLEHGEGEILVLLSLQ